ncbi:MAG: Fe-S cluster assembly protein SufD [Alphaproteobacteria bacterium]|nr:Fe-S cluster assembly protein SufD [Alphaproteobacteria bacterium]
MTNDHSNPLMQVSPATPGWLKPLRTAAAARYGQLGLPKLRTEAWKFTNLKVLETLAVKPASSGEAHPDLPAALAELDACRILIVDGKVVDHGTLPDGVEAAGLDADAPDWVRETVGTIASIENHPFTALNTAQFDGGIALRVARGKSVETPIHLVHLSTAGATDEAEISHPRVLVIVEDGAILDLVESHQGTGAYIRNTVTEVSVGADAKLGHYKLQADSREAFHVAMTAVTTKGKSSYDNFALSTGSRLARNEVRGHLGGQHIDYHVNGAYMATGDQHLDTSTFIDHAEPNCTSHELYKGVLLENGHGVFQGKILVRPDAQKTDGYQMNRALLLSPTAEINSKPELEIYADDVKCSHGATVGELEDDQLFYLLARGVPRDRARAILVAAYVDEAIDTIDREPVREAFRAVASEWMTHHVAAVG